MKALNHRNVSYSQMLMTYNTQISGVFLCFLLCKYQRNLHTQGGEAGCASFIGTKILGSLGFYVSQEIWTMIIGYHPGGRSECRCIRSTSFQRSHKSLPRSQHYVFVYGVANVN